MCDGCVPFNPPSYPPFAPTPAPIHCLGCRCFDGVTWNSTGVQFAPYKPKHRKPGPAL